MQTEAIRLLLMMNERILLEMEAATLNLQFRLGQTA